MGFEVPISGVDRGPRRGRRAIAVAVFVLASVVGLAIATGGGPGRTATSRLAGVSPSVGDAAPSAVAALPRVVPGSVRCRDVDRATCLRMAKAALLALPDDVPDAADATVWRSLLCNESSDCPPRYLDGATPLGSVIIGFADGSPDAAVNVVEGTAGPIRHAPRAWVVRWMSVTG